VGRKALATFDSPRRSLSETHHKGPFPILLLRSALAILCEPADEEVRLVTGLPPAWLAKSAELVDALVGRHVFRSRINGVARRHDFRITSAEVLPQALGAYWSQVLTPDGELAATERSEMLQKAVVGVLDIGFKTTDLATIVDGDWVPERSSTLDFEGMSLLEARFAERLRAEFGVGFSAGSIEQAVLTGEVGFGNMQHSVEALLAEVSAELAAQLLMEIESRWQLHEFRQLLIAGGGAHHIGARLVEALPSAVVLDEPASANARGYLGFGRRLHADGDIGGDEAPCVFAHDEFDDRGELDDLDIELDRIASSIRSSG
jgi:plasmid segregation protein ParM